MPLTERSRRAVSPRPAAVAGWLIPAVFGLLGAGCVTSVDLGGKRCPCGDEAETGYYCDEAANVCRLGSGTGTDAGPGPGLDGGDPGDGGVQPDGGPGSDGGADVDAGADVDGGAELDAGPGLDAGPERTVTFTAYNDLAWAEGQLTTNVTRITSPNGRGGIGAPDLPSTGMLVDFSSGTATAVSLTVAGGTMDGTNHADGTYSAGPTGEALAIFDGRIDALGSVSYIDAASPTGDLVITLSGLDPTRRYELVFFAHRGDYTRISEVTLSGHTSFRNDSSVVAGAPLFDGPDDVSTTYPSDNAEGWVVRYTDVVSGSGTVQLTIASLTTVPGDENKGKYANALRVTEYTVP